MRALAASVLACLLCVTAGTGSALAHGEANQTIRTVIDGVSPPLPEVEVHTVASTTTALQLTNRSQEVLEVIGDGGQPFLRIGPAGVEADVNSSTWYASGNPDGVVRAPRDVELGGPPRWARVSKNPAWTWFDHRLHPAAPKLPPEAVKSARVAKLADWSIPLRYGGREVKIEGHVEYRPVSGQAVARLTSPPSPDSGVTLNVLPGPVPGLFVETSGNHDVTVVGEAGEPFARVTRRGAEVNLRSPTYQADRRTRGERVPVSADPQAPPSWKRVADGPRFSWLEVRAAYDSEQPPDDVLARTTPTVVKEWTVPLEIDGERVEASGATSWVPSGPPPGSASSGEGLSTLLEVLLAAAGVAAVALLLVLVVRRRAAAAVR